MLIANLTFRDSPNHQLEIYASPAEIVGVSVLAPASTDPVPSHNTVRAARASAAAAAPLLCATRPPPPLPLQDGIDIHGDSFWVHESYISTGDDNVAIHASDVLVSDCRFGTGHGASIGSLGGAIALQVCWGSSLGWRGAGVCAEGTSAAAFCCRRTSP